jgi:phosphoglycerate dehydrogenase-like enzyme
MVVASIPKQTWVDALADVPGLRPVLWDLTGTPPDPDIEIVVPPYMGSSQRLTVLAELPGLRAVQLLTAGYEQAVEYLPAGVQLANGAGVHDTSTAELALTLTLAALRGVPEMVKGQLAGSWQRLAGRPSLADRRVLLVGYGAIGRAVARRLSTFEVSLTAVASRPRHGDDLVSRVHGIDELPELLPEHDVVILIVPLTDSTRRLVDGRFLGALPDGALVVNVARGAVVDTDALQRECAAGRLLAALDVTDPEPLPDGHPLWSTPGVLISPHVGGASTAFEPRALALLRRELAGYAAGDGLSNVVLTGGE